MSSPKLQRAAGVVLAIALLFPLALCSGCATKTGTQKKSGSPFALPTWKTEQKPKKPKKDPGTPVTVGDFMMLPRNDVL